MLSDSKIMTKTSVGRAVKAEIMGYNLPEASLLYSSMSGAMVSVRVTLSSHHGGDADHVNGGGVCCRACRR